MRRTKRILDLVASVLTLIVLAPFLGIIAMLVRVSIGAPVLFRQPRAGYQGRIFSIYKFRSMTEAHGSDGTLLADGARLTPLGRFLRAASLDELPELINVLRGEMSLVGPRPLLEEYLPLYSAEQRRRHDVYPGITGWAQINGRNAITWADKFKLDVWYVDNQSFWLDLKIMLRTPGRVIQRVGINQPGRATVDRFKGGG